MMVLQGYKKFIVTFIFLFFFLLPFSFGVMSANLDIATLNTTYVPYIGSINDTNLGVFSLYTNSIIFNTSYRPSSTEIVGTVYYDAVTRGLEYVIDQYGSITIGREMWDYLTNVEGSTILNGDVVSVVGATGNREAVKLTNVSNSSLALTTVAMVTVPSILNNQPGRFTTNGAVNGLNTSGFTEGDVLYVDCLNPGKLTNIIPDSAGCYNVRVGVVTISHPVEGAIKVNIMVMPRLDDLSDVVADCEDNDILQYNITSQIWECYKTEVYGELWGHEIGDVNILAAGVYYNVTNLTSELNNGFNFNTTGQSDLEAVYSGVYKIVSQWSFSDGATQEFHLSLSVNGVQTDKCHAQRKLGTAGDVGSASYTCLLRLTAGDYINPVIENVVSTNNPTIHDFQLSVVRIGN